MRGHVVRRTQREAIFFDDPLRAGGRLDPVLAPMKSKLSGYATR
jgi:hypothetical protein